MNEARFWINVHPEPNTGCWLWSGPMTGPKGYGQFHIGRVDGKQRKDYSHRIAYRLERGPIPDGLVLDHLCRTPACCNPSHLQPVSHRENIQRGSQGAAKFCLRGHPYNAENTGLHNPAKGNGLRYCRACKNEKRRREYAKAHPVRRRSRYSEPEQRRDSPPARSL